MSLDDDDEPTANAPGRSNAGLTMSPVRTADDDRGPGLQDGEVVAFAVDGLPYVVDVENSRGGDAVRFGVSRLDDARSIADPATHLTVVKQGRYVGFASQMLGGKMLQARQRTAGGRLCFYNPNFGVNEQWETNDEPEEPDWSSCEMRLKNRRLPSCILRVEVMRVPRSMRDPGDGFHNPATTPRGVRAHPLADAGGDVDSDSESDARSRELARTRLRPDPTPGSRPAPHAPSIDDLSPRKHHGTASHPAGVDASRASVDTEVDQSVRRLVGYHELEIVEKNKPGTSSRPGSPARRLPPEVPGRWEGTKDEIPVAPGSLRSQQTRSTRGGGYGYGTGGGVTPGVSSGGRPPPGHRRDSAGEQSHALRSMSGVLIKEWSAFVLKEVRARKEVERQMLELRDEMRGMADVFRAEIGETRAGWISDAQFYGAKVREAYESQAAQRLKVMTMAARTFFQRWLTKAWRTWVQVTEDRRRRRVAANRALRRMYFARLAAPFATWREYAKKIARMRRALLLFDDRRGARTAVSTLRAWRHRSVFMKQRRRLAHQMRVDRVKSCARRALITWRMRSEVGGKSHEHVMRCIAARAVTRMKMRCVSNAFDAWAFHWRETRRLKAAAERVIARWTRAAVADTFYSWVQVAKGKQRRRDKLSALVLRVLGRQLHSSFMQWLQTVRKAKRDRHVVGVIGRRLNRDALSRAFTGWCQISGAQRSHRNRVLAFTRRTLTRWAAQSATMAFERWRSQSTLMRVTRVKAERLVRTWRYRDVANAFEVWQTHTLAMLAARDSAVLFAVRLMRGSAYKALNGWRDAVRERRRMRKKVDKLLRGWLNRNLSSAFRGWHATVVRFKVHRARVRSFVWRMRYADATRSFRGWRETTALLLRQRSVAADIHGMWTHKTLAAAFRSWSQTARQSKDKLARAKKIVARMRSMKQSIAFVAWRDAVERLAKDRAVANKIVRRMMMVKITASWYKWIDWIADRREWRAKEARAVRFATRRARDRVEAIWEAWFTEVKRLVVYRRRATKVVARIRNSVMTRSLNKWLDATNEIRRMRWIEQKGAAHFAKVLGSRIMRAWRSQSFVLARKTATAKKAARKMNVLRTRHWWKMWLSHVADNLHLAAAMRRAVKSWTKGQLGQAWRKWLSHIDRARVAMRLARHQHQMRQAVYREKSSRVHFQLWKEWCREYRRLANLVQKAYVKSQRLYKQSVFNQWREFLAEIDRRKETVSRAVTSKRLLTSWFLDWYWQAFEGDISSALGLITGNTDAVIEQVYGEDRRVDRGVFQEWQQLGSSLDALTQPLERDANVKVAAAKFTDKIRRASVDRRGSIDGASLSSALSDDGSRGGFDSPGAGADESFRSADAGDSSFATPGGGSAVSSPGFTGGKRLGSSILGGSGGAIGTPGSVKSNKERALDRLLDSDSDGEEYTQSRRAFANAVSVDSD